MTPSLRDPVTVKATIKRTSIDGQGECQMTLIFPAADAGRAAQLSVMRDIVFQVQFTPCDVNGEPTL